MVSACPHTTLNSVIELYCVMKFNDRRKYFKEHLIIGQEVWKDVFVNTIFATKNEYVELKKGDPYNYVDIPEDSIRFLSLGVKDHCDNIKPLFFNPNLDVVTKPKIKPCGCDACNCESDGLCGTLNSLSVITKPVVIDGTTYTEYTWISVCPNGDVMEYREIPTTQYTFDYGAYDNSYDISYDIGTSGSSVVVYKLVRKLCKLEVAPCGCPTQTQENQQLFFNCCSCFINPVTPLGGKCVKYWGCNSSWAGECNISPCGTKIIVKHVQELEKNHQILMKYQTNGVDIDGEILVPNYANMAIMTGIEYRKKLFNDRYNATEKQMAYYKSEEEKDKIIVFLNQISTEWLQDLPTVAHW